MAVHWIGKKKIAKFSRKTGIDFIAGESVSGSPLYVMMCSKEMLYMYHRVKNITTKIEPTYRYFGMYKTHLINRAEYLKKQDLIMAKRRSITVKTPSISASILKNHHCKNCGWPIITTCVNDEMLQFVETQGESWDWWQYCSNKGCKNHKGEGVFQNTPDWIKNNS